MKASFNKKLPIAENIYTFEFNPDREIKQTPGQFIRMNLEHDNPDERGTSRFFTLSSSPTDDHPAITTKFNSEHSSSFKIALQNLKTGDKVTISNPDGEFTLPDKPTEIVFVAGGIGVTPYHSILKYLSDKGTPWPIHLIYGARTTEEIAFKPFFDSLSWLKSSYLTGKTKLSGESILAATADATDKLIYLSGPEPMVESLQSQLQDAGIGKKQIRTDFFPGYKDY